MPTLIENIEFYHEIRNFDTGATNKTSVLKANAGEKVRASIQFRVQIESRANPGNGDEFLVQTISGVTSITSNTADFVFDGWRVGDGFTFTDNSGGGIGAAPGQVITLVTANFMEITLNAPLVPNTYTDADMQLTTELDQLIFQYNFTDLSNKTDLIQQLLQSIQLFEYNGLTDLVFHAGVARQPDRGNTGSSQAKRRVITANFVQFFEIEHDFIVIPAGREDQLSNLQTNNIPDPYRNETLFYKTIIEMGVGGDNARLRSLPLDRIANDSVGWRNENFDGGVNTYNVESFAYSDPALPNKKLDSIEAKISTRVFATISTTGAFNTTDPFVMHFSYLPEINVLQSTDDDYQTATIFDSVRNTIDGGAIGGTVITALTGVLNGGDLDVQFDVAFTQEQLTRIFDDGAYELYISLANNSLTAELSDRVALSIDAARLTKIPDITGLVLNESMQFYDHVTQFTEGSSTGNSSIETWIEEGFMLDGSFDLNVGADLVDIDSLFIEILAQNTVTDNIFIIKSYTIPTITQTILTQPTLPFEQVQIIELDNTQGFLLKPGDQNNFLKMTNGNLTFGNQNYKYQIGLKMSWQDWEALNTVDGIFFDTNELNNGLNKKADRFSGEEDYVIKIRQVLNVRKGGVITTYNAFSPEIRVFDYEKDRNITPDFTGSMVFQDENNNGLSDNVIANENSTVTVTFDDGNTKTSISGFEAIIRIQEKVQGTEHSIHEISSLRGVLAGNLLTPLAGESNTNKSIVAGNFTAKCLVDGDLLIAENYTLSSRLFEMFLNTKSVLFDGLDEDVDLSGSSDLDQDGSTPFSISMWVKIPNLSVTSVAFANFGNIQGYIFRFNSSENLQFILANNITTNVINVRTTTSLTLNTWANIIMTYDGSKSASGVTLYFDASSQPIQINDDTLTGSVPGGIPRIGSINIVPAQFFTGNIDEVSFWNKELTQAEVTEIYNLGVPKDLAIHSAIVNLKHWWRMGDGDTFPTLTDNVGSSDGTMRNMESGDIVTDTPP